MYFDQEALAEIRECIKGIKDVCDRIINYKPIKPFHEGNSFSVPVSSTIDTVEVPFSDDSGQLVKDLSPNHVVISTDQECGSVVDSVVTPPVNDLVIVCNNQGLHACVVQQRDIVLSNAHQTVVEVVSNESTLVSNKQAIQAQTIHALAIPFSLVAMVKSGTSALLVDSSAKEDFFDKVEVPIAWDFDVANKKSEVHSIPSAYFHDLSSSNTNWYDRLHMLIGSKELMVQHKWSFAMCYMKYRGLFQWCFKGGTLQLVFKVYHSCSLILSVASWKFFDPGITLPSVSTPGAFSFPKSLPAMILYGEPVFSLQESVTVVRYDSKFRLLHATGWIYINQVQEFMVVNTVSTLRHMFLLVLLLVSSLYKESWQKFLSKCGLQEVISTNAHYFVHELLSSLVTVFVGYHSENSVESNMHAFVVESGFNNRDFCSKSSNCYVTVGYLLYSVVESTIILERYSQFQEFKFMSFVVVAACANSGSLLLSEMSFLIAYIVILQWRDSFGSSRILQAFLEDNKVVLNVKEYQFSADWYCSSPKDCKTCTLASKSWLQDGTGVSTGHKRSQINALNRGSTVPIYHLTVDNVQHCPLIMVCDDMWRFFYPVQELLQCCKKSYDNVQFYISTNKDPMSVLWDSPSSSSTVREPIIFTCLVWCLYVFDPEIIWSLQCVSKHLLLCYSFSQVCITLEDKAVCDWPWVPGPVRDYYQCSNANQALYFSDAVRWKLHGDQHARQTASPKQEKVNVFSAHKHSYAYTHEGVLQSLKMISACINLLQLWLCTAGFLCLTLWDIAWGSVMGFSIASFRISLASGRSTCFTILRHFIMTFDPGVVQSAAMTVESAAMEDVVDQVMLPNAWDSSLVKIKSASLTPYSKLARPHDEYCLAMEDGVVISNASRVPVIAIRHSGFCWDPGSLWLGSQRICYMCIQSVEYMYSEFPSPTNHTKVLEIVPVPNSIKYNMQIPGISRIGIFLWPTQKCGLLYIAFCLDFSHQYIAADVVVVDDFERALVSAQVHITCVWLSVRVLWGMNFEGVNENMHSSIVVLRSQLGCRDIETHDVSYLCLESGPFSLYRSTFMWAQSTKVDDSGSLQQVDDQSFVSKVWDSYKLVFWQGFCLFSLSVSASHSIYDATIGPVNILWEPGPWTLHGMSNSNWYFSEVYTGTRLKLAGCKFTNKVSVELAIYAVSPTYYGRISSTTFKLHWVFYMRFAATIQIILVTVAIVKRVLYAHAFRQIVCNSRLANGQDDSYYLLSLSSVQQRSVASMGFWSLLRGRSAHSTVYANFDFQLVFCCAIFLVGGSILVTSLWRIAGIGIRQHVILGFSL